MDVRTQSDVGGIGIFGVHAPYQGPNDGGIVLVVVEEFFPYHEAYLGRKTRELGKRLSVMLTSRLVGLAGAGEGAEGLLLVFQPPRRRPVGIHLDGNGFWDQDLRDCRLIKIRGGKGGGV